jgi:hypothetical protein
MTETKPPPPPPGARGEKIAVQPGFAGALRGVWLLTWRSQLTWQRLSGRLGMFLLPFLIWITTQSPEAWARRHAALSHLPPPNLDRFVNRLEDAQTPLQPQQKIDLTRIFNEEYATAGNELREAQSEENAETRLQREHAAAAACAERISGRARETLDESQFDQFQSFEAGYRQRMEQRINNSQEIWSRPAPFYHWLVDVYFFILLPLACVRGSGALMRDELQADTLGFLITRPVSRARLLCVKYLSQLAWLQVLLLTETLLIFGAGAGRQIPGLGALLPLFVAVQFLAVPAWSALGIFLGQITSRYMAIALVYGAIVEMGIGRIPTNINVLSMMRHLKTLLSHNGALQGIYDWPMDGAWLSICALVVAPVLFLGAAAVLFSFMEYLPASEMHK